MNWRALTKHTDVFWPEFKTPTRVTWLPRPDAVALAVPVAAGYGVITARPIAPHGISRRPLVEPTPPETTRLITLALTRPTSVNANHSVAGAARPPSTEHRLTVSPMRPFGALPHPGRISTNDTATLLLALRMMSLSLDGLVVRELGAPRR